MIGAILVVARARRGFVPNANRRIKGVLRVAAYVACVFLAVAAFGYRSARAEAGESALRLGRDLAPLRDLLDGANEIDVNGQRVFLQYDAVEPDVKTVLDRFAAHCAGDASPAVVDVAKAAPFGIANGLGLGYFRRDGDVEGAVVCLVRGNGSASGLRAAADAFADSHDLGVFGKLRYAFARKTKGGHTLLLTLWTEDRFDLDAFSGRVADAADDAAGRPADAPGTDSAVVPRPPGGTRILDASLRGRGDVMRVYRSDVGPKEVQAFYDRALVDEGYVSIDPPGSPAGTRVYARDGASVALVVGVEGAGASGRTLVGFAEMRTATSGVEIR